MDDRRDNEGMLYLVPTPIGNRGDITLRALEVLRRADVIACEDTRHSKPLLEAYDIHRPLLSFHKFNETARAGELLDRVQAGEEVALISDAGMPGISDPGARLIAETIERNLPYTVLPGASASVTAMVASGLGDGRFLFLGFLPRKGKEREQSLLFLESFPHTAVIYEAPHRIRQTVSELGARFPDREFALVREYTKQYEEVIRFRGVEADNTKITERGEFVLVLGPVPSGEKEAWDDERVRARLKELLAEGWTTKEARKQVVKESGRSRNEVYQLAL